MQLYEKTDCTIRSQLIVHDLIKFLQISHYTLRDAKRLLAYLNNWTAVLCGLVALYVLVGNKPKEC